MWIAAWVLFERYLIGKVQGWVFATSYLFDVKTERLQKQICENGIIILMMRRNRNKSDSTFSVWKKTTFVTICRLGIYSEINFFFKFMPKDRGEHWIPGVRDDFLYSALPKLCQTLSSSYARFGATSGMSILFFHIRIVWWFLWSGRSCGPNFTMGTRTRSRGWNAGGRRLDLSSTKVKRDCGLESHYAAKQSTSDTSPGLDGFTPTRP